MPLHLTCAEAGFMMDLRKPATGHARRIQVNRCAGKRRTQRPGGKTNASVPIHKRNHPGFVKARRMKSFSDAHFVRRGMAGRGQRQSRLGRPELRRLAVASLQCAHRLAAHALPNQRLDVVWYRLHLTVAPRDTSLATEEWYLGSAFEIYSNGVKTLRVGSVKPYSADDLRAHLLAPIPRGQIASSKIVIAVRTHVSATDWTGDVPGLAIKVASRGLEGCAVGSPPRSSTPPRRSATLPVAPPETTPPARRTAVPSERALRFRSIRRESTGKPDCGD